MKGGGGRLHGTTAELQSRNDAYPTNYPPVRRVERGRRDDLSVFSEFVSCITRKCGKTHLERYEAQQKESKEGTCRHVDDSRRRRKSKQS